jgi:hypothetical protein
MGPPVWVMQLHAGMTRQPRGSFNCSETVTEPVPGKVGAKEGQCMRWASADRFGEARREDKGTYWMISLICVSQ